MTAAKWACIPNRSSPRFLLPVHSSVARSSLRVYQPVTLPGLLGWNLARGLGAIGGFHLLPGTRTLPDGLNAAIEPHRHLGATFAVARANHPFRHVVFFIGKNGKANAVVKIAQDATGRIALASEAMAIESVASRLPRPLQAPRLLSHGEGFLILEPIDWKPRVRAGHLNEDVAYALGRFFSVNQMSGAKTGPSHGDFAPWNLLRTGTEWVVLDWEHYSANGRIFHDLFHYFVQSHALLGYPTRGRLIEGLKGKGWVGRALKSYCEGAEAPPGEAYGIMLDYLEESARKLNVEAADGRKGLKARQRLLASLSNR